MGTIDSSGNYRAPATPPAANLIIAANLPDAAADPSALTATATIRVVNPVPSIAAISPTSVPLGTGSVNVAIEGTGFNPLSSVLLDGQPIVTSFNDTQHLSINLDASFTSIAHVTTVSIVNGEPGGGSATSSISVLNPLPVVTNISPSLFFAGDTPVSITISGSGFIPSSIVSIAGSQLPATYLTGEQLQVTVPSSTLTSGGTYPLAVTNAAPGGGSSSPQMAAVIPNGQINATGNPQVASYSVTAPDHGSVSVEFGEQDYTLNTSAIPAPAGGGIVRVLVAGMKPNTRYHMRALLQTPDGNTAVDLDHVFNSGSMPPNLLPTLVVTRSGLAPASDGIQLFDDTDTSGQRLYLFAADMDGNIIWTYYQSTDVPLYQPAKLLDDGNILLGVVSGVREINLAGEVVQEISLDQINSALTSAGYSIPISSLHHDMQKLANGHYILLGNTFQTVTRNGESSPIQLLGDVLIDIDSNLNVVWVWNSFDHLDVNRHPVCTSCSPDDWTHGNAVLRTPDGNLLFSMRNQSWIVKIDYRDGQGTGDILWRLGYGGDFSLNSTNTADWFYTQHYPNVLDESGGHMTLAVFDDGTDRVLDTNGDICVSFGPGLNCHSRAVIFDLDEQNLNARIKWQNPLNDFTFWGGSILQLSNGNVLADLTQAGPGARVLEMTQDTPSIPVWEMDVVGQNAYRAIRYPSLYPGVQWP